jgi:hypothetical protein
VTGDHALTEDQVVAKQKSSMRTRSLILLVLLVTLSGCIVTYRDFSNATLESLPKDHAPKPLYYHVEPIITKLSDDAQERERAKGFSRVRAGLFMTILPGWYPYFSQVDPIGQPGYHEVGRTLTASVMFSDLIEASHAPEAGVYCYVDFEIREPSPWVSGFLGAQGVAGILTVGLLMPVPAFNLLPYYTGEGGTTVIYKLYRDGQLKQTYRYPITKQGAGWIVLLPFAWLNFFTNDLKDAVRGATLQFLIDAQRDGNL